MVLMHPEIAEPGRTGTPWGRGKWKKLTRETVISLLDRWSIDPGPEQIEGLRLGALELARTAIWGSDDWGTTRDERGADRPDAQAEIWSWLSRRSCLLKAVGSEEGQASLVVRQEYRETVQAAVVRSLGLAPNAEHWCDVFYAWRCPCNHDHRVEYETINDLPAEVGYHDACPRCGAAPLEVIQGDSP